MYFFFELVARSFNPQYIKPDQIFYGVYGSSVILFMICIAVNMNILFTYYIQIKEAGDTRDPGTGTTRSTYMALKIFVMWFTILVLLVMFSVGISIISISDVTAKMLGNFYTIAGFTFLVLSFAFLAIAI